MIALTGRCRDGRHRRQNESASINPRNIRAEITIQDSSTARSYSGVCHKRGSNNWIARIGQRPLPTALIHQSKLICPKDSGSTARVAEYPDRCYPPAACDRHPRQQQSTPLHPRGHPLHRVLRITPELCSCPSVSYISCTLWVLVGWCSANQPYQWKMDTAFSLFLIVGHKPEKKAQCNYFSTVRGIVLHPADALPVHFMGASVRGSQKGSFSSFCGNRSTALLLPRRFSSQISQLLY